MFPWQAVVTIRILWSDRTRVSLQLRRANFIRGNSLIFSNLFIPGMLAEISPFFSYLEGDGERAESNADACFMLSAANFDR